MAEIRKYDPAAGNAIAQALRAAMGDPVRPVAPGGDQAPARAEPPAEEESSTSWVSLTFDPTPRPSAD